MPFDIIWPFLWFAGFALLAIFNRRLYEWMDNRRADRRKAQKFARYYWQIKDAFKWTTITMKATTVLYAIYAFNGLLGLVRAIALRINSTIPTSINVSAKAYSDIFPLLLLVPVAVLGWATLKGMQNYFLIPIAVTNESTQSLSIYLRNHMIGVAEPGQTVKNNRVGSYFKKYLIQARDSRENVLYSEEFGIDELIRLDGKIRIIAF